MNSIQDNPTNSAAACCTLTGKYTADQLMSMAADAARRAAAAGRRGAFGSAASRKPRSSSMIDDCLGLSSGGGGGQSGVPGPGCYDAGAGLADRVAVAAARPSAVSLSQAEALLLFIKL